MKQLFNTRSLILVLVTSLHLAVIAGVVALMTQPSTITPVIVPPSIVAQLLPQLAPQTKKEAPQPLPQPAPLPKQPAPPKPPKKVVVLSEHALTAPKQEPVATQTPIEKSASPTATPSVPSAPSASTAPITAPRVDATYLNNPKPDYPPLMRKICQEGSVLLRVHITTQGTVDDIDVLTHASSPLFDEAAVKAVRQWHFVPAHQGDTAIAYWYKIQMPFMLK